jgi:K+-sensing histidine kinase KdpD
LPKTLAFVTNQYSCDRIIRAARTVADETGTDLVVVGVLDSEYTLDPEVVDYLFSLSKKNKAVMRLLFSEDKTGVMTEAIVQYDSRNIVTGMPHSNDSVLYKIWKMFPAKQFFTVELSGELIEVAQPKVVMSREK